MPQTKGSLKKPLKILFEDECYLVVDKPSGLLVIATPKNEKKTLVNLVNAQSLAHEDSSTTYKLHPCHRLDRDTSGAIIFAKGKRNQQLMMREFQKRTVLKTYTAFVHGRLNKNRGEIKSRIRDLDKIKHQRRSRSQMAVTRFKVQQIKKNFSIVEVYPLTGRTNQIRIHLRDIGHPIVGERKYAFAKDYTLKFRRTALHAKRIEWKHPQTHKMVKVIAPLPEDMKTFLNRS